jgi:hypothetical protein
VKNARPLAKFYIIYLLNRVELTVEILAKPPLRIKTNNIDVQQAEFL